MYSMKTNIANRSNYGAERSVSNISYIVLHYTANDGDTDEANGNYFHNNIVNASAHYFVDSDSVTQSVPDNFVAWSVGGGKYNDCAQTGGGKFYNSCTNNNSISIELCDDVKNGVIYPSDMTITNAVELTKQLMKLYNIPVERVIRHFDVNGKHCPAYWCLNTANDNLWLAFKNRLIATNQWYRVRKSWADAASQTGAYKDLNNAIAACGAGYSVFDDNGNVVYTTTSASANTPAPTVKDHTDPVVTPAKTKIAPHVTYSVMVEGGKRYAEVTDYSDYAGWNEHTNITCIAARVDVGSIKYRVHVKGGSWLPWVTGCNWADHNNGYAGNGKAIDAFQGIYLTPSGAETNYLFYRSSTRGNGGYLPEVKDDTDYCGNFGQFMDGIQIRVGTR